MKRNEYLRCNGCGEILEAGDLVKDYTDGRYRGEAHESCPYCGEDDLENVAQCACCGAWVSLEAWPRALFGLSDERMLCKDCFDDQAADVRQMIEYGDRESNKAETVINGFLASVYTPDEIEDILMRDFTMLPERKQKRLALAYAEADADDFAEYAC